MSTVCSDGARTKFFVGPTIDNGQIENTIHRSVICKQENSKNNILCVTFYIIISYSIYVMTLCCICRGCTIVLMN